MKGKSSKIFWSLVMFSVISLYAVLNMIVDWSNFLVVNSILFLIFRIYFQYNLYTTIVLLIFIHGIYLIAFFITSIFYFNKIHLSTTFIMKRSLFRKNSYKINASIHPITFLCIKKHEKQFVSKKFKYNKNKFFSQIMAKDFNLAIQNAVKIIQKNKNITTITFKTHKSYITYIINHMNEVQNLIKKLFDSEIHVQITKIRDSEKFIIYIYYTDSTQYEIHIDQKKRNRLYIEPFAYLSLWQSIVHILKHPKSLWERRQVYNVMIKKVL
ncbi:hypothetical protein [Thermoanaerobacter wiegelii]|uniref:Uncharacterized protein n=1 Tax=Thermoanaerobacter wiegelii Rt8.B1 TaxID=697303 RepID=G2MRP6_9THEO|nr:hypothetical protein [Thermoanaerobacter wiegelii]AEM79777.1 hypothetical protein Thewi_2442 [Thermoanaerobacter wiegelii Rt8.B1]